MKWNSLSSKKKSGLIFAATLILLIITWISPIKRTIQAKRSCESLKEKIKDGKNAPAAIAQLESSIETWSNEMITDLDAEALQIKLFEEVGGAANKYHVQIRGLRSIGIRKDKEFCFQTFEVIMVGGFKNQLQVLFLLEKHLKYGKVASVEFSRKKVKGKKYEELFTKLLIQSATKQ
ncbi:hypothetical protein DMA11_20660 [Marinilabiliaceae bacterium JC017]|nr:hypothetical protein DMA11_20660 [Marinilabiliaceae bacterium JC017]